MRRLDIVGTGDTVQFWFVGVDPALATVIVSHQGTDFSKIGPVITDAEFFLENLNPTLFPGLSSSVKDSHCSRRTAQQVLAAVNTGLTKFNVKTVTIVGHSLGSSISNSSKNAPRLIATGAAIGLIDFIYLPLHITTDVTFRAIFYGMPRVRRFPQLIIVLFSANSYYSGRFLGFGVVPLIAFEILIFVLRRFHHPTGEIHIQHSGRFLKAFVGLGSMELSAQVLMFRRLLGQDNTNNLCTTGDVGNIFEGVQDDHGGKYSANCGM
ncbi:hypothetical protein C8J57DRAFT_1211592 [Mycena rebaudengoi]|nr:hypothetical protein C8J57DRAFT_1211592 [Mycena rebaudengoi]